MSDFVDLLITDDDLTLQTGEPLTVSDLDCISQDIKHMIREKGYLVRMVGNRNEVQVGYLAQQVELEMEKDPRLVPGTALVSLVALGKLQITATTTKYGDVNMSIQL